MYLHFDIRVFLTSCDSAPDELVSAGAKDGWGQVHKCPQEFLIKPSVTTPCIIWTGAIYISKGNKGQVLQPKS
jgi:hypothetical protein